MKNKKKNKKSLPIWAKWTIFGCCFAIVLILIGILVWLLVLNHTK